MDQSTNPQEEVSNYSLVQHIEAILFWKGDTVSISTLSKITGKNNQEVIGALGELKGLLSNRGIVLIEHDGEFTLGTNPESSRLIEAVRTEELSKDLGKASLETLAIVLYQGPIRRSEIDYIRGVNSNFILRNLLIRGLIERKIDKQDSRAAVYQPTLDLLRFLGITEVAQLEDFDTVKETIQAFRAADSDEPQVDVQEGVVNSHKPQDHDQSSEQSSEQPE